MKVLHINAGLENGGGLSHIIGLLSALPQEEVTLLTFANGPVAEAAKANHIKVKVMDKKSRYDMSLLKELARYINDGQFDIVHTHGARANLFLSMVRHRIKAKWMITVHSDPQLDFMQRGLIGWVFTKLNIRSLKKADGLFVVTNNFRNILLKLGIENQKIRVIYNGIQFQETVPNKKQHTQFEIVMVGRLHPVKGHALLLEAFKAADLANAHLTIIGDGDLKDSLTKMAIDLGIGQQVSFTGLLTQKQINQHYLETDLAVLSSYSESFPLVLLEAANYAVPVVTTDVGDMHELIPDEQYGWVVPVGDQVAFTEALKAAHTDWQTGSLSVKGERLRERAKTNFSVDSLCEATIMGYNVLLNEM